MKLPEAMGKHLAVLFQSMEWYCQLPSVMPGAVPAPGDHPGTDSWGENDGEPRERLLDLYQAVLRYAIRAAGTPDPPSGGRSEPKEWNDVAHRERRVIFGFDPSKTRMATLELTETLNSLTAPPDDDEEEQPLVAKATDSPSLNPEISPEFYSLQDELPHMPAKHLWIQDLAFAAIAPTPEFAEWKARDKAAVLWLTGGPGTGKSTVLQGVARNIARNETTEKGSEKLHVAAFLCNTGRDRPENAAAIVQCLLFQVLDQQPGPDSRFKDLFKQACSTSNQQAFDKPEDIGTISEAFRTILSEETFVRTCFILDALDECYNDGGENESTQAFWALLDLVATTSQSSKAMWLLSVDTQRSMDRMSPRTDDGGQLIPLHLSLDPRPSATSLLLDAATEHTKLKILALRKTARPSADTSFYDDVERKMVQRSAANFLWTDLAAREIQSHGLPWNALRFLNAEAFPDEVLPGTVPELYNHMERCIKNLKWDTPLYCSEILETMAAAFKPLSIRELEEFTVANIPPIVDLETIIEKQCFQFLQVHGRRVRFVHQSAKSFFRERIREKPRRHAQMTKACLQTLSRRLSTPARSANWSSQGAPPPVTTEVGRAYVNWYWLKHFLEFLRSTDIPGEEWVETLGCVLRFLRDHLLKWLETLTVSPGLAQALSQLAEVEKKLRVLCFSLVSIGPHMLTIAALTRRPLPSQIQTLLFNRPALPRFVQETASCSSISLPSAPPRCS